MVQIHQDFIDYNYLCNNSFLITCHRRRDDLCIYNQDEPTVNRSQYVHIWETGTHKIGGYFLHLVAYGFSNQTKYVVST